tara:strand:- start:1352 stop:1741 length:390 start_codon:yes stop_codon:yes gene_type:complete
MDKKDRLRKLIDSAEQGNIADQLREKIINDKQEQNTEMWKTITSSIKKAEVDEMYKENKDLEKWVLDNFDDTTITQVSAMYTMLRLTRSIRYKHHKQAEKEIDDIIELLEERIKNIEPDHDWRDENPSI